MSGVGLSQQADFRTLVDHLDGTAIWIVSGRDDLEYISDGFEDIWGIPPAQIRDDPARLMESVHPEDREMVWSHIGADTVAELEDEYEHRIVGPDGDVRWVKVQQVPIRAADGSLDYIVGVTTDITEQKRREQELEVLNRLLRHDIRNDVTVILGWAQLLDDHVDDAGADYLARILNSGEHIVELTDLSQEYVETVTDGTAVQVRPIPLRSTLEREVVLRRETYPNAEFVITGDVPDVDVKANELLGSVFRNVLNNAVQHNDASSPAVEIACTERETDVVVRIADNGPGIPESQRESIFSQGEKGAGSSGTGIGLHLVRTLITEYGGEVWAADDDPTGTRICIRLRKAV